MGKAKDALKEFINDIPADKLTGFPNKAPTTLYSTKDFRLDLQSVREEKKKVEEKKNGKTVTKEEVVGYKYNLQVQANSQSEVTSIRKVAPKTVAGPVLVDMDVKGKYSKDAGAVRAAFLASILL